MKEHQRYTLLRAERSLLPTSMTERRSCRSRTSSSTSRWFWAYARKQKRNEPSRATTDCNETTMIASQAIEIGYVRKSHAPRARRTSDGLPHPGWPASSADCGSARAPSLHIFAAPRLLPRLLPPTNSALPFLRPPRSRGWCGSLGGLEGRLENQLEGRGYARSWSSALVAAALLRASD